MAGLLKQIHELTEATAPSADTDVMPIEINISTTPATRKITWANIKTAIGSALGAIINAITAKTSLTGNDLFVITDSAASNATKKITWANVMTAMLAYTGTFTNKRITKRVSTATDDATAVIDSDSYDEYYLTAIANNTEITITGTPTAGQTIFVGLKDAGVSKTITWTGITALGVTLPTATTAGKQHIIGVKYIASAWRAIAVAVEA